MIFNASVFSIQIRYMVLVPRPRRYYGEDVYMRVTQKEEWLPIA